MRTKPRISRIGIIVLCKLTICVFGIASSPRGSSPCNEVIKNSPALTDSELGPLESTLPDPRIVEFNSQFQKERTQQNQSYLASIKNPEQIEIANFERVESGKRSEVYRVSIEGETNYYRPLEQSNGVVGRFTMATSRIADILGEPHLSPNSRIVEVTRNGQRELGVLSASADGVPASQALKGATFKPSHRNLSIAKAFAYLTRNVDPHLNNFFIDPMGRFQFTDSDLCFGEMNYSLLKRERSTNEKNILDNLPNDKDRQTYANLGHDLPDEIPRELHDRLKILKSTPLPELSALELKQFHERIDKLLKVGIEPDPPKYAVLPDIVLARPDHVFYVRGHEDLAPGRVTGVVVDHKAFVESYARLRSSDLSEEGKFRTKRNIEALRWGAENGLVEFNFFPGETSWADENSFQAHSKSKVSAFINSRRPQKTLDHELDHVAVDLIKVRESRRQRGIKDGEVDPMTISDILKKSEPTQAAQNIKSMEKGASKAEREAGNAVEFSSFAYPRSEFLKVLVKKVGIEKIPENKSQIVRNFQEIFDIHKKFSKEINPSTTKQQPEPTFDDSDMGMIFSFLHRTEPRKEFFTEPKDNKVDLAWLTRLFRLSGSGGRLKTQELEALVPYAQEAWDRHRAAMARPLLND